MLRRQTTFGRGLASRLLVGGVLGAVCAAGCSDAPTAGDATTRDGDSVRPRAAARMAAKDSPRIADGSLVSIEYRLVLADGSEADSNADGEPFRFRYGAGELLPAVEKSIVGLKAGDKTDVLLTPEVGFGTYDPDAREEIDLEQVPVESRSDGALVVLEDDRGVRRLGRLLSIADGKALLDTNHPLAGQTVMYKVEILAVE